MTTLQRHQFIPDPAAVDWRGETASGMCCGLSPRHDAHQVPPVPGDVAEVEARRLGEPAEEIE